MHAADGTARSALTTIADLEDSVAHSRKPAARALVREAIAGLPKAERGRIAVRINPLTTPSHEPFLASTACRF